jgi:hypothetical protein
LQLPCSIDGDEGGKSRRPIFWEVEKKPEFAKLRRQLRHMQTPKAKKNYSNQEPTPFANTWGACNRFLVDQSNTLEKEGNEKILS